MAQAGILGSLKPYNDDEHGFIIRLGFTFGEYKQALQPPVTEKTAETCGEFIEYLNEDLSKLGLEFKLTKYTRMSHRNADEDLRCIRGLIAKRYLTDQSKPIYFVIGVAAGILQASAGYLKTKSAEVVLMEINMFQSVVKIHHEILHRRIQDVVVKDEPFNSMTRVKMLLQEFKARTKILFVTADPEHVIRLRVEEEFRELQEALSFGQQASTFELQWQSACRREDLQKRILAFKPNILHFAGHAGKRGLCFEDDHGGVEVVPTVNLKNLLDISREHGLQVVILNACSTAGQSEVLSREVDYVVSMKGLIGDKNAIAFTKAFYYSLGHSALIEKAFNFAMAGCDLPGDQRPQLVIKGQKGEVEVSEEVVEIPPINKPRQIMASLSDDSLQQTSASVEGHEAVASGSTEGDQLGTPENEGLGEELSESAHDIARHIDALEINPAPAISTFSEDAGLCKPLPICGREESPSTGKAQAETEDSPRKEELPCESGTALKTVSLKQAANDPVSQHRNAAQSPTPQTNDAMKSSPQLAKEKVSAPQVAGKATATSERPQPPGSNTSMEEIKVDDLVALYNKPDFLLLGQCARATPASMPILIRELKIKNPALMEQLKSYPVELVERLLSAKDFAGFMRIIDSENNAQQQPRRTAANGPSLQHSMMGESFRGSAFMGDPFFADFFRTRRTPATRPANPYSHIRCQRCKQTFPSSGGFVCRICAGVAGMFCIEYASNESQDVFIKYLQQRRRVLIRLPVFPTFIDS
ncbi:hypothetical protein FGRMN_1829 [Fusarium graminum]|nr:hypothetical protein FGRMN_1829 [Fusarium graminum]